MDDQKPSWTQWIDQFPGFPQFWSILHQVKCAKCPFFCEFPWCLSSTARGVPVHLCHLRSGMPLRRTMGDPVWQLRLQGKKNTKQGRRMMEDDQQFSSVFKSTSWSRISRVYTYTIPTILGLITIHYENPQSPTIISSIFRILTLLTKAEHAAQLLNANSGLWALEFLPAQTCVPKSEGCWDPFAITCRAAALGTGLLEKLGW